MRGVVVLPVILILVLMNVAHASDTITLISGEELDGTVIERGQENIVLQHPILGDIEIPLTGIELINGTPMPAIAPVRPTPQSTTTSTPDAAVASMPAPAVDVPAEPEVLEPDKPKWKSQIEVGANGSQGSTETADFRTTFRTSVEDDGSLFRFDTTYRLSTDRGDRTENRVTVGTFNEWKKANTDWTAFLQSRFDADEFQPWDSRITASGGLGYVLRDIQRENADGETYTYFKLTGRIGGGLRKEFGSPDDELAPEGLLGAEFSYAMNGSVQLAGGTTFFPEFRDSGEFRLVSNLDLTINIEELEGINLKFGVTNEYESLADPSFTDSDFSAYAALVFNF
ncbi:MAG: DUF481 domain-containing protein [Planctomycetota bacterium]